jgi:leucyl aminopeptidase
MVNKFIVHHSSFIIHYSEVMELKVKLGKLKEEAAEVLVVGTYEKEFTPSARIVDEALGGMISKLVEEGDCKGDLNEIAWFYPWGEGIAAKRLLLVGLGKKEELTLDKMREVSGTVSREISGKGLKSFVTTLYGSDALLHSTESVAQALIEGSLLSLYKFDQYKSKKEGGEEGKGFGYITVLSEGDKEISQIENGVRVGHVVSEATNFARDLINHPGNVATPTMLAQQAEKMAGEMGLRWQVLSKSEMEELKMGALLSVARGSQEPAKFIILEHNADKKDLDTTVLVGKGITFDSGGISIKPAENMDLMKMDMSGGAAVMATLKCAAALNLPLHVVGLIPATENLPSGSANKPGDVVTASSGTTIEILNTDAEGRLILADALTYARRYTPKAVVDLATLTGACVIALGHLACAMLGNNRDLLEKVRTASELSGERVWELPLWDDYKELIKGDVADIKNTAGREGGTITAAAFLSRFAEDYPWVHLDIAGTAWSNKAVKKSYLPKGGFGFGVRLLVQFLRDWRK